MRGSVRKRGSTWTWYLDAPPDPVTGKRRQASKGGFRTKRECPGRAQRDARPAARGNLRPALAAHPRELPPGGVAPCRPAAQGPAVDVAELPDERRDAHRPGPRAPRAPAADPRAPHRLLPLPARPRPPGRRRPGRQDGPQHPRRAARRAPGRRALGPRRPQRRRLGRPAQGHGTRDAASGARSSSAPSSTTPARTGSTPPGCCSPPPACGAARSPGSAGPTSTWRPPASHRGGPASS